jgi:uncharacterized membrane protein
MGHEKISLPVLMVLVVVVLVVVVVVVVVVAVKVVVVVAAALVIAAAAKYFPRAARNLFVMDKITYEFVIKISSSVKQSLKNLKNLTLVCRGVCNADTK